MMFRYYRFFLILIIAALTSCNQYNRILEEVYDNDQAAREWTRGMSSLTADEIVNYSTEMERVDSLNQATVFGIVDKEGWPSHLSDKANRAIWIVIDHSDKLVASYSILDNEHSPAIHCKGIHFSVGG